jgi:hypothetical protein
MPGDPVRSRLADTSGSSSAVGIVAPLPAPTTYQFSRRPSRGVTVAAELLTAGCTLHQFRTLHSLAQPSIALDSRRPSPRLRSGRIRNGDLRVVDRVIHDPLSRLTAGVCRVSRPGRGQAATRRRLVAAALTAGTPRSHRTKAPCAAATVPGSPGRWTVAHSCPSRNFFRTRAGLHMPARALIKIRRTSEMARLTRGIGAAAARVGDARSIVCVGGPARPVQL